MKKHLFILAVISLVAFTSCDFLDGLDDYKDVEVEYASTYPISGEYYADFIEPVYGSLSDLININIYNTAADDGQEVWIYDNGEWWDFKVKCAVDMSNNTFGSADTLIDEQWGVKVVVQNGEIFKEVYEQPSGVMSDSIYFEIWIEDVAPWYNANYGTAMDLNAFLAVQGFRRSGFLEDEH